MLALEGHLLCGTFSMAHGLRMGDRAPPLPALQEQPAKADSWGDVPIPSLSSLLGRVLVVFSECPAFPAQPGTQWTLMSAHLWLVSIKETAGLGHTSAWSEN